MALLLREIIKTYSYLNEDLADPRTKNFFLFGSPWSVALLLVFYVNFVRTWGPRLMQSRKPFQLDRILQIYNVVQILISAYLFKEAATVAWLNSTIYTCDPVDFSNSPTAIRMINGCWYYFVVKMIDLLDTLFFVLRKKQSQVTFLHVYHHTAMVVAGWGLVKWLPGGHLVFVGLANSFVHIVMYSYYLLTSLKLSKPWWKKHLTQMQLLQFSLILLHDSQMLWRTHCEFPRWIAFILIPQNLSMVALFGDFYYRTYVKRSNKNNKENGTAMNEKDK